MLALPLPAEDISYRVLPFQLHKNIGLTLLISIVVMVAMRLITNREQAAKIKTKQEKLALIDYWAIYVLIGTACLTGYLSSSYSGWETVFWWLVDFPAWAEESDELNILFSDLHKWSCWALLLVAALHISAALYHGFRNDDQIKKMFDPK